MFFDPIYWCVIGFGMLLSLWAQARVKGTFAKYGRMRTRSGMTWADVAREILSQNGIRDVAIEPVRGVMTDHYDPRTKTLLYWAFRPGLIGGGNRD